MIGNTAKIIIIKNWLRREGQHIINALTEAKKETYRAVEGIFSMFSGKFEPHHNETILSPVL